MLNGIYIEVDSRIKKLRLGLSSKIESLSSIIVNANDLLTISVLVGGVNVESHTLANVFLSERVGASRK